MKIYNTLTRSKEEFVPITPGEVRMYCCGQTVYNDITLGNARSFTVFDAVRRYMIHKGYSVRFVMNFTDVDDKIIKRANDEGVSQSEIAERYIVHTLEDLDSLNILRPTVTPRATQEIGEIISMVQTLIDKGYAYEADGSVFFETVKSDGYGKLSRKKIDGLEAGARIEVDSAKRSPTDFVLWKPAKPDEPFWESPWGNGRPGWHIECSAMARKYLGPHLDIHGGGADLIFPHHENEIAQSESANGEKFANYWMHNGLLTVGHKKMGKSLGNFTTLRELAEKFPYDVIRFYLVGGHYRMPMEYGEHLLEAAKSGLSRIKNCAENLRSLLASGLSSDCLSASGFSEAGSASVPQDAEVYRRDFETAMDDDFNTADAVASIFELVKFINLNLARIDGKIAGGLLSLLEDLCGLLGIVLPAEENALTENTPKENAPSENTPTETDDGTSGEIESLIKARQEARAAKDWKKADEIRDELNKRGVELKDTVDGVRWSFK